MKWELVEGNNWGDENRVEYDSMEEMMEDLGMDWEGESDDEDYSYLVDDDGERWDSMKEMVEWYKENR